MSRLGKLVLHGSATRHATNIESRPPVETGQASHMKEKKLANDEIWYLELLEVGRQIQSRDRSSVEVAQALLERIEMVDGALGSYRHLNSSRIICNGVCPSFSAM